MFWFFSRVLILGLFSFAQTTGTLQYNTSSNDFEFYDGTSWMVMDHGTTGVACTQSGTINYNTTNNQLEFCDGSFWKNMMATDTLTPCTQPGEWYFDLTASSYLVCDGSSLWSTSNSCTTPVIEAFQDTSNGGTDNSSITLTAPGGITTGELLMLIVGSEDASSGDYFNPVAGWTKLGEAGDSSADAHIAVYWKKAAGGEGNVTVSGGSFDDIFGWYLRISCAQTTVPINASNFGTTFGSSFAIPAVTTNYANTLALYGQSFDGGDGAPFSVTGTDWAEEDEQTAGIDSASGSGSWGSKTMATAGSSGNATVGASISDGVAYFQLALNPMDYTSTTPNAFTFNDQTGVARSTLFTSNIVTIDGVTEPVSVSISGDGSPQYRIDGGGWTASPGTIESGQTLQLRLTSSASYSTTHSATVNVGGSGDIWSVTTISPDTTPNAFTFTDQTGVNLSTLTTSDILQISGINVPTNVSISGSGSPEYRICANSSCSTVNHNWTSGAGSIDNGEYLQLRLFSSFSGNTTNSATITVGTRDDTWSVTTLMPDTTPDPFNFFSQSGLGLSDTVFSSTLTITGIAGPVSVSVSGEGSPAVRIAGGSWTTSGTIYNGQTLQVYMTTSATANTTHTATINVGTESDVWGVTTAPHDYRWRTLSWGACSATCAGGTETRTVYCHDFEHDRNNPIADSFCSGEGPKPPTSQVCNAFDCRYADVSYRCQTGRGDVYFVFSYAGSGSDPYMYYRPVSNGDNNSTTACTDPGNIGVGFSARQKCIFYGSSSGRWSVAHSGGGTYPPPASLSDNIANSYDCGSYSLQPGVTQAECNASYTCIRHNP